LELLLHEYCDDYNCYDQRDETVAAAAAAAAAVEVVVLAAAAVDDEVVVVVVVALLDWCGNNLVMLRKIWK